MATFHNVGTFEELIQLTSSLESKAGHVYVYFTGAKDESGKSWCPDCVSASPIIEETMKKEAPGNSHFIIVSLQRSIWKDPTCIFRTDKRLQLSFIPALVRWPRPDLKLQMEQCLDPNQIKLLFED